MKFKNPLADLRLKYRRTFEISLILALALMIIAFKFFPDVTSGEAQLESTQELFTVEDIQHTKQENRPPPPPKPTIPIEAPSDDVLEDIEIGDTEIDLSEEMEAPPPPPKEEKKVEEEPTYFVAVEEMPEPVGGIKAIQEKLYILNHEMFASSARDDVKPEVVSRMQLGPTVNENNNHETVELVSDRQDNRHRARAEHKLWGFYSFQRVPKKMHQLRKGRETEFVATDIADQLREHVNNYRTPWISGISAVSKRLETVDEPLQKRRRKVESIKERMYGEGR